MFSSQEWQNPELWSAFSYFTETGTDGTVAESLDPHGKQFKLAEVRLHFSIAFASTEDFTIKVSSIKGSAYNITLVSQALLGVKDFLYQLNNPFLLLSDDQVVFGWSQVSATNVGGLDVLGWGVQG